MRYELIMEHEDVALIDRGSENELYEYAVVRYLNKEKGCWGHTIGYAMYSPKYFPEEQKAKALKAMTELYLEKAYGIEEPKPEPKRPINWDRMCEIASAAIQNLEFGFEWFMEDAELTEEEKKFFELETEEE